MKSFTIIVFSSLLATTFLAGCRNEAENPVAKTAQEQLYTCGMHPQVLEHSPGKCPICGMDLVPVGSQPKEAAATSQAGQGEAGAERKIKYWRAPMDPTFVSDKPGKSPMGMDLIPVYADEVAQGSSKVVHIDPVVVQNMGVRVEPVARRELSRHIRTIGEVAVSEDELSVVNLRFAGWVEKLYADKTGEPVEKDAVLFDIYSPDLVASQQEYLLAIRAQGAKSELARSARRKLELWDISNTDIDAIAKGGQVMRVMPIRAPRSGFVLKKNIVEGARIEGGEDLYQIGNLSRVWVVAEVYEYDAPWVKAGQPVQMELTYERGRVIEGTVAYVYPTLDEMSRTARIRLELENPGYTLKPGMFATVYIQSQTKKDVLVLPTEAVIHSGKRELVFVSQGDGHFEAREITTGLVGDDHFTEVLSGVSEGEQVVASGQFLIDSESQLQEAIQKMLDRRKVMSESEDLHEGMQHEEMAP